MRIPQNIGIAIGFAIICLVAGAFSFGVPLW